MINKLLTVLGMVICFGVSASHAAIFDFEVRLGGLAYYDPDLDITWLADATSNGNSGNWISQTNSIENTLNVAGITGWRLPTAGSTPLSCPGDGCLSNEMGYMFHDREINSGDMYVFNSIQADWYYSSSAVGNDVWLFNFLTGEQQLLGKNTPASQFLAFTWAVHDGDVEAVIATPLPAAVWMFGSAVVGFFGFRRRKKALAHL